MGTCADCKQSKEYNSGVRYYDQIMGDVIENGRNLKSTGIFQNFYSAKFWRLLISEEVGVGVYVYGVNTR